MTENESLADRLAARVEEIHDFPKPGLVFRDVSAILVDPALFRETVDAMAERVADHEIDLICGIESRGFIFSAALAYRMNRGFLPIRWSQKLPADRRTVFQLEYGFNAIEIHPEAFEGHKRVLLVDDLLATGSTIKACADLVRQAGGEVVAAAVVVEVPSLEGRVNLEGLEVVSLCRT